MPTELESILGYSFSDAGGSGGGGGTELDQILGSLGGQEPDWETTLARKKKEALERLRGELLKSYPDLPALGTVKEGRRKLREEFEPSKPSGVEGAPGAAALGALEGMGPAALGFGAGGLALAAGAGWPLALAAGLVGGYGASRGQSAAFEAARPGTGEEVAAVAAEHPKSFFAGSLAPSLALLKPDLRSGLNLGRRAVGAAAGAGVAAIPPIAFEHRAPTWGELAVGAALGATTKPRPITEYTGLTPARARARQARIEERDAVFKAEEAAAAQREEAAAMQALREAEGSVPPAALDLDPGPGGALSRPPVEPDLPPGPRPPLETGQPAPPGAAPNLWRGRSFEDAPDLLTREMGVAPTEALTPFQEMAAMAEQNAAPREAGMRPVGEPVPVGPRRPGEALREAKLAKLRGQPVPAAEPTAPRVPEPDIVFNREQEVVAPGEKKVTRQPGAPTRNRALREAVDDLYRRIVEGGEAGRPGEEPLAGPNARGGAAPVWYSKLPPEVAPLSSGLSGTLEHQVAQLFNAAARGNADAESFLTAGSRGVQPLKEIAKTIAEYPQRLAKAVAADAARGRQSGLILGSFPGGAQKAAMSIWERLANPPLPPPKGAPRPGVPKSLHERAAEAAPPPEPVAKLIEVVSSGMAEAKVGRSQQARLLHKARQEQAARLERVFSTTKGRGAMLAARETLKGSLPEVEFKGLGSKLSQSDVEALYQIAYEHPTVAKGQFDKLQAGEAVASLLEPGRTPQPAQLAMLEKFFGPQLAAKLMENRSFGTKVRFYLAEGVSLPRAFITSLDMSAPLRQGFLLSAGHPVLATKATGGMVKSFFSESTFQAIHDEILARPNRKLYTDAKLDFSEQSITRPYANEERFINMELVKRIPVLGQAVKASNRAYSSYLNKMRADVFDQMAAKLARDGVLPSQDPLAYRTLAEYINDTTGRSRLPGNFERVAKEANAVFFAPRRVVGLVRTFHPKYYLSPNTPKALKVEAWRNLLMAGGAAGTFLTLGALGGGTVEKDLRSTDAYKLKVGQTRLDPWAGFQTVARFAMQMATGERKTASGAIMPAKRSDLIIDFIASKFQPSTGFIRDVLRAEGMAGQSLEAERMLAGLLVPLYIQDAAAAMGIEVSLKDMFIHLNKSYPEMVKGFALSAPAFFGAGVQTYGEPIPEDRIVKTPAENAIFNFAGKHAPESSPEQKADAQVMRRLEDNIRHGADPSILLTQALESGVLTPKQADGVLQRAKKIDAWVVKFGMLSVPEAEEVMKLARPAERAKYGPLLEYKRASTQANQLWTQDRLWRRDRIGSALTAADRAELAQLTRTLKVERRRRKMADQARRLALAAGLEE